VAHDTPYTLTDRRRAPHHAGRSLAGHDRGVRYERSCHERRYRRAPGAEYRNSHWRPGVGATVARVVTSATALLTATGGALGLVVDQPTGAIVRLATAATAIHDLLGYPYVAIALSDSADPTSLVLRGVAGPFRHAAPVGYRLPLATGITGAAARERRLQLVNDVTTDPRYLPTPGASGIRAELAVPIARDDEVFGAVNVEGSAPSRQRTPRASRSSPTSWRSRSPMPAGSPPPAAAPRA